MFSLFAWCFLLANMLKVVYIIVRPLFLPLPSRDVLTMYRHTWGLGETVTLVCSNSFIFLAPSQGSISLYSCPWGFPCQVIFTVLYFFVTCYRCSNQYSLTFSLHAPPLDPLLPETQSGVNSIQYQSRGWLQELLLHHLLSGGLISRELSSTCQPLQGLSSFLPHT